MKALSPREPNGYEQWLTKTNRKIRRDLGGFRGLMRRCKGAHWTYTLRQLMRLLRNIIFGPRWNRVRIEALDATYSDVTCRLPHAVFTLLCHFVENESYVIDWEGSGLTGEWQAAKEHYDWYHDFLEHPHYPYNDDEEFIRRAGDIVTNLTPVLWS